MLRRAVGLDFIYNYWRKPCATCEQEYWFEVDEFWSYRLGDIVIKPFQSLPA